MSFTDTAMLILSTTITVCYLSSSIIFIRSALILVQVGYFFLALYTGLDQLGMKAILILSVTNSLINGLKIVQYYYENSIRCLPKELHDLYQNEFNLLSPKEFKLLYQRAGKEERTGKLISANKTFENLMFVLEGTPVIRLQKGKIIRLTKRVWLGEMSFLRDEVTSADVITEPTKKVKLLIWSKYDISELVLNDIVRDRKLKENDEKRAERKVSNKALSDKQKQANAKREAAQKKKEEERQTRMKKIEEARAKKLKEIEEKRRILKEKKEAARKKKEQEKKEQDNN